MTINRKSILVQSSTGSSMNVTTDKVEGDGYYGYSDGTHTLAVAFSAFKGRVSVQGTLSLTPTETDWFSIQIQAGLPASQGGYKQFPVSGTAGYTGVEAYTVVGNFTYLRVVIDRSHLGDGTTYATDYGSINYIRMSA
jgi:hypothetical protein|tara:strand:+ start:11007 stop:11420 length:414 start_codon:yes stop_codon:yes gene_type:complete